MARPKPAIPGTLHVPAPPPDWYIRHHDHRGRIIPAVKVRERADQALRKIKKEPRDKRLWNHSCRVFTR